MYGCYSLGFVTFIIENLPLTMELTTRPNPFPESMFEMS